MLRRHRLAQRRLPAHHQAIRPPARYKWPPLLHGPPAVASTSTPKDSNRVSSQRRWLKAPVRRSFRKSSANTITYARPPPRKSPRIADTATTPEPKRLSATSTAILLATSRRHPKSRRRSRGC